MFVVQPAARIPCNYPRAETGNVGVALSPWNRMNRWLMFGGQLPKREQDVGSQTAGERTSDRERYEILWRTWAVIAPCTAIATPNASRWS
jgi:hypothetical protein